MNPPTGLTECPHCGSDQFYVYETLKGSIPVHHRYDGEEADNTHMWDYVRSVPRKTAYCSSCHKRIGKVENN